MVSRSRLHRFAGDPGTRVEGQKARRTGERHRKLLLLAVHMYHVRSAGYAIAQSAAHPVHEDMPCSPLARTELALVS